MRKLQSQLSQSLNGSIKSMKLPALSSSPKSRSDLLINSKGFRMSPRIKSDGENSKIPEIKNTASSSKRCGYVFRYAANTNKGSFRNYNEDRLSIVINIPCPSSISSDSWPHSSFFGIYDGHGGKACANYLKDNLHRFIFDSSHFPKKPKQALLEGFQKAEDEFLNWARENSDNSGSCVLVVMILGGKCYVANTGDSRAIVSSHQGGKTVRITKDHKPDDPLEQERIIQAGGTVVTHNYPVMNSAGVRTGLNVSRIIPGNIAISRTIGDIEIKNAGVIIHTPDIKSFRLTEDFDFIVLASDGIYDKLNDKDVTEYIWKAFERENNCKDRICSAVEDVMKYALIRGSEDNVSVILICFKGIQANLDERKSEY